MLTWHYIPSAQYNAATAAEKTSDKIFFLSDTKEIYRGTNPFTESVVLYDTLPGDSDPKATGKLYVNNATLEGRVWTGTAWKVVIKPVAATLDATNEDTAVSGKAVASYVTTAIADVTGAGDLISGVAYVADGNKLTLTMTDETTKDVSLTGVAVDLSYDKTTGKLQALNAAGTALGTGINLDLERFVKTATYDAENKKIILTFNDESDPLEVEVGDLVDTYTAKSSETINLTVTANEFTAEAIIAADEDHANNQLVKTANGLYVAPTNVNNKINKVVAAEGETLTDNIALLTADGSVKNGAVKVGAASLSATPTAAVLATEAAVASVRTALTDLINAKMAKVGTGHNGEVIVATADGDASASGFKVGSTTFAETGGNTTLATEAGVANYVGSNITPAASLPTSAEAASDTKAVSEKALIESLTWKTTV